MRPGWQVKDTSVTAWMTPRFLSLKVLVSWWARIMGRGSRSAPAGERQGEVQTGRHGDSNGRSVRGGEGGADADAEGDTDREGHGLLGGFVLVHGKLVTSSSARGSPGPGGGRVPPSGRP